MNGFRRTARLLLLTAGTLSCTRSSEPAATVANQTPVEAATAFMQAVHEVLADDPAFLERFVPEGQLVAAPWNLDRDAIRPQVERVIEIVNANAIESVRLDPGVEEDFERGLWILMNSWMLLAQPWGEWRASLSPFTMHPSKQQVRVQFGVDEWWSAAFTAVLTEEAGRWRFAVLPGEDEIEGVLEFEYRDGQWWCVPPD